MSWNINGFPIPSPDTDSYKIERNDIDSSQTGRLDNGYMFRERIRTGVYKVSCTWHLTSLQKTNLESLLVVHLLLKLCTALRPLAIVLVF